MRLATTKLLFLAAFLLATAAAPTVNAKPDCNRVRGIIVAHLVQPAATCPMGTIAGVAGDVFDASDKLVGTTTACLTSQVPKGNNGAISATLMHTFIFTLGELQGTTISTQDRAVLSPAGRPQLFSVNNRLDITTGGRGWLHSYGIANFANGDVMLRYDGRICTGNSDDSDDSDN